MGKVQRGFPDIDKEYFQVNNVLLRMDTAVPGKDDNKLGLGLC